MEYQLTEGQAKTPAAKTAESILLEKLLAAERVYSLPFIKLKDKSVAPKADVITPSHLRPVL